LFPLLVPYRGAVRKPPVVAAFEPVALRVVDDGLRDALEVDLL
jgi:hypothetical protein